MMMLMTSNADKMRIIKAQFSVHAALHAIDKANIESIA